MTEEEIDYIIENIKKIPEKFFVQSESGRLVCWLLDREDGTADSYETSQERFGIWLNGDIIWGFSSGCSCWEGWESKDYELSKTYKEFVIKDIKFAEGWEKDIIEKIKELQEEISSVKHD